MGQLESLEALIFLGEENTSFQNWHVALVGFKGKGWRRVKILATLMKISSEK